MQIYLWTSNIVDSKAKQIQPQQYLRCLIQLFLLIYPPRPVISGYDQVSILYLYILYYIFLKNVL